MSSLQDCLSNCQKLSKLSKIIENCPRLLRTRAAKSVGTKELGSSIAKDLIDSEDPKHTLFCRKIAFAAIYALFRDNITIF